MGESPNLSLYHQVYAYQNIRINPGLRHRSRLWSPPTPFLHFQDPYPSAQLKLLHNRYSSHEQLLMILVDAMNLFSRQLPNMGTPYIAKLVFDVEAETVTLLHCGRTGGGICVRLFPEEEFVEIAFCAVDGQYQAGGYGRLVMNHLKLAIQTYKIYDLITCADNEAVVFFKKQGFNAKEILMDPKRWVGCIKDYEGITLVHCHIYEDVDYYQFPKVLKTQINSLSKLTGIFPQTSHPSFMNYKPLYPPAPSMISIPISSFLSKYQPKMGNPKLRQKAIQNASNKNELKNILKSIYQKLLSVKSYEEIFFYPVTEKIAPQYFTKIKHPMDFLTIQKRLDRFDDYYKTPEMFALDIQLIVDNSKTYNAPETTYYKNAVELLSTFKKLYEHAFPQSTFFDD